MVACNVNITFTDFDKRAEKPHSPGNIVFSAPNIRLVCFDKTGAADVAFHSELYKGRTLPMNGPCIGHRIAEAFRTLINPV